MLINPYEFAVSGGGGGGDPHWANVGLLLLGDDDGSHNAKDSSSFALATVGPTNAGCFLAAGGPTGGPAIDLAGAVGGNTSGFDVQIAAAAAIDLSAGDYTIEGFFYPRDGDATPEALFFALGGSTHLNVGLYTGDLYAQVSDGGGLTSFAMAINAWYHVAIIMQADHFSIAINGVLAEGPIAVTRNSWVGQNFWVGGYNTGPLLGGKFTNVRVTKGVARYTSFPFSPPVAPFPNH